MYSNTIKIHTTFQIMVVISYSAEHWIWVFFGCKKTLHGFLFSGCISVVPSVTTRNKIAFCCQKLDDAVAFNVSDFQNYSITNSSAQTPCNNVTNSFYRNEQLVLQPVKVLQDKSFKNTKLFYNNYKIPNMASTKCKYVHVSKSLTKSRASPRVTRGAGRGQVALPGSNFNLQTV